MCLQNWRLTSCGAQCTGQTQADLQNCKTFLDCYQAHNCGPNTCGGPNDVCGVNVLTPKLGSAPKTIGDSVYSCLGCSTSSGTGGSMGTGGSGGGGSTGTGGAGGAGAAGAGGTSVSQCLTNWRSSSPCGAYCKNQTQADRKNCQAFLDCYQIHNCGPTTCGAPNDVCGVNSVVPNLGSVPKDIADLSFQCMACPGSTPATNCSGKINTTPCTDSNACTLGDKCQSNACVSGTPKTCTALDQCHNAGTCAPATGACSNPNKTNGANCNDSNACTAPDSCQAGVCQGTALLAAPTGLTATGGSAQISLSWTAVAGATFYTVKRSNTSGGPYTVIGTPSMTTFVDTGRAIGPTYYYVVSANAACGESANSSQLSGTATSGKTGTFPPGPGPCKPAASAAVSSTSAQVIAVYGSAAMPLPSSIAGATGGTDASKWANRKVLLPAVARQSARVQFELKKTGSLSVVAPTFASRIDGYVIPNPALIDRILVVAKTDGVPTFVAAVPDPRIRRIHRNPNSSMPGGTLLGDGGAISVDLPEMFLAPNVISNTVFEFHAMSNRVPSTTPVTVGSLVTLLDGATALAISNGAALSSLLFGNPR